MLQKMKDHLKETILECYKQFILKRNLFYLQLIINQMNIVGTSNNSKNIVSLEQLVPQHDCLKLLILHTPYTLVISTLNLCVNLVKLDLSKNNLQHFPYLGNLSNLKFMFIHQNKLDIAALKNIFQLNGKKSNLSNNIVWVTYWGNKNSFLGRHYLVNETNAIAIDRNMVVHQQRSPNFPYDYYEPFCQETDLSDYFDKKAGVNRFASEQEYMKQLWLQMSQLRKKHERLFPIVKIQKVFRGWIERVKKLRLNRSKKQYFKVLRSYFSQWKKYSKRQAKLMKILKQKRKQFLLLDIKQMKKQENIFKMVQIAQQIKKKFLNHKISLTNQYRFYNIVRQNYLKLKNLYNEINVNLSKSIYIHKNQWQLFTEMIIPFLKAVNPSQEVVPLQNQEYSLHLLYEFHNQKSKEFIKIMQTNIKSLVYDGRHHTKIQGKRMRKPLLYGCNLKQVYRKVHISNKKKVSLQSIMKKIEDKRQIGRNQFIKIQGSQILLKDIVRGIYLFNTGRLQFPNQSNLRINVLTQYSLKKIVSVTKIQKIWRGYSFRKKNNNHLKTLLKAQRAAIIIQRWIRKLPHYKKSNFIYSTTKKLQQVKQNKFYIDISEYFSFLDSKLSNNENYIFQQLDSRVYLHNQSNSLCLGWNNESQNMQILQNIRMRKCLFNRIFLSNKVELTEDQINIKAIYDDTQHVPCSYAHIFHYGTQSSIISKGKKRYLQIKCTSKNQAKFRIFILLLCTYQLTKKNSFTIYYPQYFKKKELSKKAQLGKNYGNFICNQNFTLIKQCEVMFRNEPRVTLHVINNKFYFQAEQKPVKIQQKFFIYTYDLQQQEQTQKVEEFKQQKVYHTQKSKTLQGQFRFLTENMSECELGPLQQQTQPTKKIKIMIKKRSVKQYKIEKKAKSKKRDYPSFMLDSMSIKDRLTTQPDIIVTQMSQQNNSLDHNIQDSLQKNNVNFKAKHRMTYAEKRNNSFKKKDDQNFTRRFVNLGNFIQNQYANDYRRRIKTEMENRAADSADHIRRQIQRSQSHKVQENQQKYKKIRQKHVQHRQLVQKTQSLMRQRSLQTKTEVNEARDKKIKERSKLKRLKVSFAQQCYPLASKQKKYEYFP